MAVRLSRTGEAGRGESLGGANPARWTCAFVNNMPDPAFAATERQIAGLLDAGAGAETVELRRYIIKGVPRGDRTAPLIADGYSDLADLEDHPPPDLLIVTGSEPLAPTLADEPYWADLVWLLSWAQEQVQSMLLSCLTAHAALVVFDGLARTRLPAKCTGVFAQEVDRDHRLAAGLSSDVVLPHSRFNTVHTEAVRSAGYNVVLRSERSDWSVAAKLTDGSEVVLVQSHPEYTPPSLLLEYQRDVRRYLGGERDDLPCLPLHCVTGEDWSAAQHLQARMVAGERSPELLESFPFADAVARASWQWRDDAIRLYANWLAGIPNRS
jgi:homoserine O-succinyltransferase/O-acetyltransferase